MSQACVLITNLQTSMDIFDETDQITIWHFLSKFVKEYDLEETLGAATCLEYPVFLKEKAFNHSLATNNSTPYTGLRYWPEYITYFISTYDTTMAVQKEFMQLK